jgi:RNA polymerase sigma-70 factor, ECF subfamily
MRESASEQDFNDLYRNYGSLVHAVLLARLPRDEVQDVLQEVFLAAFKSLHTLREWDAAGAWLVRIARNHAANYYRSARRTEELTDTIEAVPSSQTRASDVLRTIKSLPDAYRETLVLRLVEGMTGEEIARNTGMTPESVRVNLHRGMKKLREKLGLKV